MKTILRHLKVNILKGIIALIPLVLTVFIVRLLYVGVDQRMMGWIDRYIGFHVPGLGIILVSIILYTTGLIASNVAGRQFFMWLERLTRKLPLINTTYHIGKQLSETLALPEKQVFKKAVLVDFLKPGIWTIGFITGSLIDRKNNNQRLYKIYVPTPPNPTSGFIVIAHESEIRFTGWSIEEAMQAVISGGLIGPSELR